MEGPGYTAAADSPWPDYLRPSFDQPDFDDADGWNLEAICFERSALLALGLTHLNMRLGNMESLHFQAKPIVKGYWMRMK